MLAIELRGAGLANGNVRGLSVSFIRGFEKLEGV